MAENNTESTSVPNQSPETDRNVQVPEFNIEMDVRGESLDVRIEKW